MAADRPAREPPRPAPAGACPICRAPVGPAAPARPFCSPRCKMVDLGRWFLGVYAVPGEPASLPLDGTGAPGAAPSDAEGPCDARDPR